MDTKKEILEILYQNREDSISGESIAKRLGLSRNSVWKAINSLKAEGYEISSKTKNGYKLISKKDVFNSSEINRLLNTKRNIIVYREEDSSNRVAKSLAQNGVDEGTVVIVEKQTNGRGRLGRTFISESENGLYMSIVLRPKIPVSESVKITVIGALAVSRAIEATSAEETKIKWVNDIYIKDKKVCGILTEASFNFETGLLDYAVIGIGVNIATPNGGFDKSIDSIAGAIFDKMPSGYKALIASKIIDNFFSMYENIEDKKYILEYKKKSNIIGENVKVICGNRTVYGKAVDIDDEASLVVKTENGEERFNSGEASVRKDG